MIGEKSSNISQTEITTQCFQQNILRIDDIILFSLLAHFSQNTWLILTAVLSRVTHPHPSCIYLELKSSNVGKIK